MASLNRVSLIGRLGKDPEVRFDQAGEAVAKISLATEETWKDKQGIKQVRTDWHRLVFFGRLAEVCGDYLKKGNLVFVEGRIHTRKWKDEKEQEKYITEVVGGALKMLDVKSSTKADEQRLSEHVSENSAATDSVIFGSEEVPF